MPDSSSVEIGEQDLSSGLENYVLQAGNLIKEERYKDAIGLLSDSEKAEEFGFKIEAGMVILIRTTPDESKLNELSDFVASHSHFINSSKTIKLANPFIFPDSNAEIPLKLMQDIALTHLEEWTHGLQYLRGSSLTGENDFERDILIYFQQKGIPLSDNYLRHKQYTV